MKHTTYTKLFFSAALMALCLAAFAQNQPLTQVVERATTRACSQSTVQVEVTLAKPVRMSDVMYRPVRGGKDMVIRMDYKKRTCSGRLSAQKTHVYMPLACVQDEHYKATQLTLTFADGRSVKKPGKALEQKAQTARIKL